MLDNKLLWKSIEIDWRDFYLKEDCEFGACSDKGIRLSRIERPAKFQLFLQDNNEMNRETAVSSVLPLLLDRTEPELAARFLVIDSR